jgi:transcriptional regulator with XRE-family HTH domain
MPRVVRTPSVLTMVGKRLRYTCKALRLTSRDFSASIDVRPNTYSQWETGSRLMDIVSATALADRYGLTLDWLYRGDVDTLSHALARKLIEQEKE